MIHFYFDIHFCQNYNWRFVYNARVTRSMTTRTKLSGFFWNCLTNSGYICPKTPKSCFKCQNEKKQISNFNRFRKTRHTKWLLFKTWFWTLEIGQNYMGFVCWRLLQKFQNEKPGYYLSWSFGHQKLIRCWSDIWLFDTILMNLHFKI